VTEYVNRERIDRGLYLLQRKEKTVQEIAAQCGFQDVNYFMELFKKQTGLTPNRYRTRSGKQGA
jgi:two-component system response regulator YesN